MSFPLSLAFGRRKRRAQARRARLEHWLDGELRPGAPEQPDAIPGIGPSVRAVLGGCVLAGALPSLAFAWGRGPAATLTAALLVVVAAGVAVYLGARIEGALTALSAAADIDAVTGARSRGWADRHLQRALSRVSFDTARPVVALVDLDGFKAVNDTFGHVAGDRALRAIAALLDDTLRAEDWAARYGGDEFIVVINARIDFALGALERVRAKIAGLDAPGVPRGLSVSVGAALARPGDELEELISRADGALYAVKAGGGDAVRVA